jgi:hypothetical protein
MQVLAIRLRLFHFLIANALFMIAQRANPAYLNGRAVRQLDIVEGTIEPGFLRGKIPFIGQADHVLHEIGKAEAVLMKRPGILAARMPHAALQNVAARQAGRVAVPFAELRLRHRASRPAAPLTLSRAREIGARFAIP